MQAQFILDREHEKLSEIEQKNKEKKEKEKQKALQKKLK